MSALTRFVFRRRGGKGWHWTDIVTWIWLAGGLLLMFGPAVWLVGSSFKTPAALAEFPPTILPYAPQEATVAGFDKPLRALRGDADRRQQEGAGRGAPHRACQPDGRSEEST
jgi:ABC-type glycerol-3-phosphate transport system permease component